MKSHPINRPGLIDQVAEDMRAQIVTGAWPVGERIPTESELAAWAGTGRNTVREAVQALVHAGLLERRQGSGTYVLATSELPAVLERHLAAASQRDVLEVRQALEILAASLAAQRRTPQQVEDLKALLAQRVEAISSGDLEAMVQSDVRLHRYIAEVSGNPVLLDLYGTVLEVVEQNVRFNFRHLSEQAHSHAELVQAIAEGDPARAAAEIDAYLKGVIAAL
ncbi:MAG: FadR family transcriptional regulator [Bifidobacteriaceae bacterium]|nr:FadR family transcriptional regulator [Bifidobacteriaceae bacterium]